MKILIIGENNLNSLERIYKKNFLKLNCKKTKIIPIIKPNNLFLKKILNFNEKYFYFIFCLIQNFYLNKKIKHDKNVYDMIIIFNGYHLSKKIILELKNRAKSSLINIQTDNIFLKKNIIITNLIFFDKIYVWSKKLKTKIASNLKINKKKIFYLPFGYDQFLSNKQNNNLNNKILFYGSWDKNRENNLNKINFKNLRIFGNGWENAQKSFRNKYNIGKELIGKKLSREISRSLVCINLFRDQAKDYINMRSFEVLGYGGSLLSEYSSEQKSFFRLCKGVIYFKSIQQVDRIYNKLLLKRKQILFFRKKNYNFIKSHCYYERAKYILKNEKF